MVLALYSAAELPFELLMLLLQVVQAGLFSGLLTAFSAVMCYKIILVFMFMSLPSLRKVLLYVVHRF